ncbi:MAG: hypothetical protein MUP70_17905 [Candidatus Aminicenantes bacterium]|nr:hypothetical protein [Candidatus Aminicenantes bacterium]
MRQLIKGDKQQRTFLLGLVLVLQIIIYAPQVGTGLVTDDFTWLDNTVSDGKVDYLRPFAITTGFFRPLVNLTFGVQYQLHGLNPRPYGWFNLFLHLINVLLVYLLLSSLEISRPYALWAAVLFGMNAKGPTMAVGWISGRTSLLYAFFSLLALYIYLKIRLKHPGPAGPSWDFKRIFRYFLVGVIYLAALLSKESAAAVPILVFMVSYFVQKRKEKPSFFKSLQRAFLSTLVFLVPLVLYLILRLNSNAMTPFNAPGYYRYTLDLLLVLKNLWEYLTRAGILDLVTMAWLGLVILFTLKKLKPAEGFDRWILLLGAGWFLVFLLPVILIPARSDIYVYLAQVGLHLAVLPVIGYSWKRMGLPSRRGIRQASILLPVGIFMLAYIGQMAVIAAAYGQSGRHSMAFTQQVMQNTSNVDSGKHIYIIDMEARQKYSPSHTVSYGFPSLLRLYFPQKGWTGEIILPSGTANIKDDDKAVIFTWRNRGSGTASLRRWSAATPKKGPEGLS